MSSSIPPTGTFIQPQQQQASERSVLLARGPVPHNQHSPLTSPSSTYTGRNSASAKRKRPRRASSWFPSCCGSDPALYDDDGAGKRKLPVEYQSKLVIKHHVPTVSHHIEICTPPPSSPPQVIVRDFPSLFDIKLIRTLSSLSKGPAPPSALVFLGGSLFHHHFLSWLPSRLCHAHCRCVRRCNHRDAGIFRLDQFLLAIPRRSRRTAGPTASGASERADACQPHCLPARWPATGLVDGGDWRTPGEGRAHQQRN